MTGTGTRTTGVTTIALLVHCTGELKRVLVRFVTLFFAKDRAGNVSEIDKTNYKNHLKRKEEGRNEKELELVFVKHYAPNTARL